MQTPDVHELVLTLIKSTNNYTVNRINGTRNRAAYEKGAKECYYACSIGTDLGSFEQRLKLAKLRHARSFTRRLFSREKQYFLLAFDHAIDIVQSLKLRFEGGSHPDQIFLSTIEEIYGKLGG